MEATSARLSGTLAFLATALPVLAQCSASGVCGVRTFNIEEIWIPGGIWSDYIRGTSREPQYWADRCAAEPRCKSFAIDAATLPDDTGAFFFGVPASELTYSPSPAGSLTIHDNCCFQVAQSTTTTSSQTSSTSLTTSAATTTTSVTTTSTTTSASPGPTPGCPASAVCGVKSNIIVFNGQALTPDFYENGPTVDQRYWAERCAAKPGCVAYAIATGRNPGGFFLKGPISSVGYFAEDNAGYNLFDMCCPLPPASTTTTTTTTTSTTTSSSSTTSSPSTTSSTSLSTTSVTTSTSVTASQNTTSSTSTTSQRFSNSTTSVTSLSTSSTTTSLSPTTKPPGPVITGIVTSTMTNNNCITVVSIVQSCPLATQGKPCTVGQILTYTIPDVFPRPTGDLGSGSGGGKGSGSGSGEGHGASPGGGAGSSSGAGLTTRPSSTPTGSSPSISAPAITSTIVRAAAGSARSSWIVALAAGLAALL